MAAQKFTKKDLKKDSFVTSTEKALEFFQRNATATGIVLLAVVVLLVGGSYVRKGQQAARVEASYMLYQGQMLLGEGQYELAMAPLQDCIDKHGGSEFGKFARLSLVQAMLGNGEAEAALARIEEYSAELSSNHPAGRHLALVRAHALADAGQYAEAADAIAATITDQLPDPDIFERTVRQATWLQKAGRGAEAVTVLETLRDRAAAGDVQIFGNELETRIAAARALR